MELQADPTCSRHGALKRVLRSDVWAHLQSSLRRSLAIRGFKQATADVFHPHIVPKSLAKLTFVNRLGHADKLTEHWHSALSESGSSTGWHSALSKWQGVGTLPCRNGKASKVATMSMYMFCITYLFNCRPKTINVMEYKLFMPYSLHLSPKIKI